MIRGSRVLIAIGAALLIGGAATSSSSQTNLPRTQPFAATPGAAASDQVAIGALDGMTFIGKLGPSGKPADVKDQLVFANGKFFSAECDKQCGYPAGPYYVRRIGHKVEFVSELYCEHKDSSMKWVGIVENGTVKGRIFWKSKRWYWTVEKELWFEGTLATSDTPVASAD